MNLNKRIIRAMTLLLSLFFVLVLHLNYFIIFDSREYVEDVHNPRLYEVTRGTIYDRTGETILAKSEGEGNLQKRVYPYGELYAHVVGHFSREYGRSGLEKEYDSYLSANPTVLSVLYEKGKNVENKGQDLYLTIDHNLTSHVDKAVKNRFGDRKNANVIVMNPKTGEVYCAYSSKAFNPNIDEMKKVINGGGKIDYRFDAVNNQFCPGSTFKIITAAAAIDNGLEDYEVMDETGSINVGGAVFGNDGSKAMGKTDMRKAIVKSSNVYFTDISKEIGKENMIESLNKFWVTKKIPLDGLNTIESGITILKREENSVQTVNLNDCDTAAMASVAFGQEPVKLSPLHMALAVSAIANDGKMPVPYLVETSRRKSKVDYSAERAVLSRGCSERAARLIRTYMVDCVEEGTGTSARIPGFKFGGKTGTAQVEGKSSHAWYVGFAPANNPQIAFCVMVENGGYGGSNCGPIVKEIIKYCRSSELIKE